MSRSDHPEFDLAAFEGSRRNCIARHLFDGRPVGAKVVLRLQLGWEIGLQRAALSRVSIGDLKGYRLRSFDDLLFGGYDRFPHALFLCETLANDFGHILVEIGQYRVVLDQELSRRRQPRRFFWSLIRASVRDPR